MKKAQANWQENYRIYMAYIAKGFFLLCPRCRTNLNVKFNYMKTKSSLKCPDCQHIFKKPIVDKQKPDRKPKPKLDIRKLWNRETLLEKINLHLYRNELPTYKDLRDAAFVCTLFITGSRVSEIVGLRDNQKNWIYEPLKKSNIEFGSDYILIHSIPVLKKHKLDRTKSVKGFDGKWSTKIYDRVLDFRDVKLPLAECHDFVKIIQRYIEHLPSQDSHLFGFSREWGRRLIKKLDIDAYCHFFRHCRATDLHRYHGMSEIPIKVFFKWADTKIATNYIHVGSEDIYKIMAKKTE